MAEPESPRAHVVEPTLRHIPECWFSMGCAEGRDDEKPVHSVWVDSFEIAAHQTTNADFALFLRDTGQAPPAFWNDRKFNDPEMPVVSVSWFDAVAYCEWLTCLAGRSYRLPTEAEWECAARGGAENQLYPWGNSGPEQVPDYGKRWTEGPERIGLYPPNAYGIYNLGDNVHEWCSDWYSPNYYAQSTDRNPKGPDSGVRRASRGGSWRHHIKVTRTAARSSIPPDLKYADYGFRIVSPNIPA